MWSDAERQFLLEQRIGRLATMGPSGPQVRPTGFRLHPDQARIDIGGARLSATQKWRNIGRDDRVAFVVDDLGPADGFVPRGVEVRGRAELVDDGDQLIRITPTRVISWGLDSDPFTPAGRNAER